jgi:hypothetical protein
LEISPVFFHIVSKLVQALVITHSEIFQALAVEVDVLLPKPFLNPRGGVQKWFREQDVSLYRQGLENLTVCCDRCLNKFGNYVEK